MITAYVPKPSGYNKTSNYDESSKKVEIWDKAYTSPKTVRETVWDIYQQGRADKYQEITSEYMLLTEKQVAEIIADALNEIIEYIKEQFPFWRTDLLADVIEKAEQLKEQQS